jgi:hypothetical protein
MTPEYTYHKPFTVWYTDGYKTDRGTDSGVYRWGTRSFSLWLHTTVFQAEIDTFKSCVMGTTEKGYTDRNTSILSDS